MQCRNYQAYLIAVLSLLAGPVEAQKVIETTVRTSAAYLNAEITSGLVTLIAHDVTVKQLVEEIAHQGGIRLMLYKPLDERVTLEFRQLPLQQAVGRILRGQNYALQCVQPLCSAVDPDERVQGTLWVFSTDDTYVRLAAVSDPADTGSEQPAVILATALGDRDASVREEAVDVLSEINGEVAIPFLEQALIDPDSDVREAAIAALTDIGGDQAARALATALNDENAALREDAVDALGDIGGKTATGLLQQALTDQENTIREAAADYLAELLNQR